MELGERAIAELLSTEAEALSPVIKTAHEPNLLSNAKPHNRYLALLQPIHLPSMILDNLQKQQRWRESDMPVTVIVNTQNQAVQDPGARYAEKDWKEPMHF